MSVTGPPPPRSAAAASGFAAALAQAQSAGAPAPAQAPAPAPVPWATSGAAGAPAPPPTVTLGQMVHMAAAASPGAAFAAASPSAPFGATSPTTPLATAAVAPAGYAPLSGAATGPASAPGWVSPVDGRVSSRFGFRIHPITGIRKMHNGIDIAAPTGTPIRAVAAGTVTFAGRRGGYGNLVILRHGDGSETRYAHQHRIGVAVGDVVATGAQLGTVGSTGASTGPHLHLELRRDGVAVDPAFLVTGGQ